MENKSKSPWRSIRQPKKSPIEGSEAQGAIDPSCINAPAAGSQFAFSIDHDRQGLFFVTMHEIKNGQVLSSRKLSEPDLKKIALHRMRQAAYNLYFLEQMPEGSHIHAI